MSTKNNPQDNFLNQPTISKQEAITLLENTINQLNNVINQLNNDSAANLPNQNILNNLVKDSNQLLTNFENSAQVNNDEWDEILEESPSIKVKSFSKNQQQISPKNTLLTTIKSLIAKPIIGITLIFVAIALIFIFNVLGSNSSQELAQNQASDNIQKQPIITETIREELPESQGNEIENELEAEQEIVKIPLELLAPEEPSLVEITLPPESKLTPEQTLIASIKNQVAEITKKYADGLILAIKANFNSSYLTVTVDDSWYEINENEQNKLAQEILEKAQILDFYKLTIIDIKGNLIARNPVAGNEMIIVRR
jgi:hypothetical protein